MPKLCLEEYFTSFLASSNQTKLKTHSEINSVLGLVVLLPTETVDEWPKQCRYP